MAKPFKIHIEESAKSHPRPHELAAAEAIANHFKSDVVFLRRMESKTPDLFILKTNIRWEIKSPRRFRQAYYSDQSQERQQLVGKYHPRPSPH